MVSSALKNLMAKKTAGATAAPVKKLMLNKKPAAAAPVEDDEAADDAEDEAPAAPAKKVIGKPVGKKPAAPVEDDEDDEAADDAEEEAPAAPAKKVIGKPVGKKPAAPVEEVEEDEAVDEAEDEAADDAEDADDEAGADEAADDAEEEEAPAAPAKKVIGKKPAAPAAPAKKAAAPAAEEKPARGLFGSAAKKAAPRKVPTQGGMITREEALRMFAEKYGVGQAQAKDALEKFEEFYLSEIFPNFSCTLFGVRFKHTSVAARVYSGTGGLNVESDGLATLVNDHTVVKATMAFGRETTKGLLNDDGEFVEGAYNAKGKFVPA